MSDQPQDPGLPDTAPDEHSEAIDRPLAQLVAEACPAPVPSPDFLDRVMSARARTRSTRAVQRRRWSFAGAGTAAALAAAGIVWMSQSWTGQLSAVHRTSIEIGRSASAVGEAGAELTYRTGWGGRTEVHQTAGNVFYRVDPGTAFVVRTGAGDIQVKGTCFRVEVSDMNLIRHLPGAGIGALLATTAVVTVYEGRVEVSNAHGARNLAEGEHLAIAPDRTPGAALTPAASDEPPENASTHDLRVRDKAHREQIARLTARLDELERQRRLPSPVPATTPAPAKIENNVESKIETKDHSKKPQDLTKAEWAEMAKRCEVRFAHPPLEPRGLLSDEEASKYGVSDTAAYNEVLQAFWEDYMRDGLRSIYKDVTGQDGSTLSIRSLDGEIRGKAVPAEFAAARKRMAEELGGLRPPADPATLLPIDRFVRLWGNSWNTFEERLAARLGPTLARATRQRPANGHVTAAGCEP